jgi:hypothetical protein
VPGLSRVSVKLDRDLPWYPTRLSGRARARYDSLFGPRSGRATR